MEKKERDPRQLTAADVEVGVLQTTAQAVKVRLWPKPERVRAASVSYTHLTLRR